MENQKIEIKVENGVKELIIRHGDAEPVVGFRGSVNQIGNLNMAESYLKNAPGWFSEEGDEDSPLQFSFVKIDRDKGIVGLYVDAGAEWESSYVGSLQLDSIYKRFKINTGDSYTTFQLADLIKMNRSYFESKDIAMMLVSYLRSFKAKVEKDLENIDDARGNKRVLVAQAVDSNIPSSFSLTLPIFKGYEKQTIDVEISINAQDFSCSLISPEAGDYINEMKNDLINEQLGKIVKLFPTLKVFEV